MKSSHSRINLLEQEKVSKALLKLGIPTMIGMMVSALYNLVDVFFVGQLGTAQICAVSIVYPLEMILLGIGLLFGAGASSFIARLLGIKAYDEASQCATTAIISAVLTGALLLLGITLFLNPILMALGATPTILPFAREYAIIIIISMVFNVFNIAVNNLPLVFILTLAFGLNGLIAAQPLADICSIVMVVILVQKEKRQLVPAEMAILEEPTRRF